MCIWNQLTRNKTQRRHLRRKQIFSSFYFTKTLQHIATWNTTLRLAGNQIRVAGEVHPVLVASQETFWVDFHFKWFTFHPKSTGIGYSSPQKKIRCATQSSTFQTVRAASLLWLVQFVSQVPHAGKQKMTSVALVWGLGLWEREGCWLGKTVQKDKTQNKL